jgi:hypothetical protein
MFIKSILAFNIIFCILLVTGCLHGTKQSSSDNDQASLLPMGAEVIMNCGNGWLKWRFENQCFISLISTKFVQPSMMSTVACPEMQKLGSIQ